MSSPTVSFAGTVEESQFNRVQQALLPIWMRWYIFVPSCMIVFVQVGAGWENVWHEPMRAVPDILWSLPVLVACAGIIKFGRRKAWKTYLRLHGSVSGQLGATGLEWKTEASTSSLPWSKVTGHRISQELALLYYAPRCAFFLPRNFFASEQDWSQLQRLLTEFSKPV